MRVCLFRIQTNKVKFCMLKFIKFSYTEVTLTISNTINNNFIYIKISME